VRKSINIWSFPPGMDLEGKLKLAKAAGFEGIELELAAEGPVSLTSSDADLAAVASMARDIGVTISSLASGLFWGSPGSSDDPAVRGQAKAIGEKMLTSAAALGTDAILLIPGCCGMLWEANTCPTVPYDVAYQRALELVRSLVPTAEGCQVGICIENVWNMLFLSPLEMARAIDEVNSPFVSAYFDVGNVVKFGYPEHWIKILGKRIKRVHFKDYRRDGGFPEGFVDLLAGDVNWPVVMAAFREIGYDGWIAPEMLPPYTHCPEQIVYNTSASVDAILRM